MGKSNTSAGAGALRIAVLAVVAMGAAGGAQAFPSFTMPKPKYPISTDGMVPAVQTPPAPSAAVEPARLEPVSVTTAAPAPVLVSVATLAPPPAMAPAPAAETAWVPASPLARSDADEGADRARHRMRPPIKASRKAEAKAEAQAQASGKGMTYTIQHGDTLSGVGRRFGVPVKAVEKLNKTDARGIKPGMELRLPPEAKDSGAEAHAKGPVKGGPKPKSVAKPAAKPAKAPVTRVSPSPERPYEPSPAKPLETPPASGETAARPTQLPSMEGHSILPPTAAERSPNPAQPGVAAVQPGTVPAERPAYRPPVATPTPSSSQPSAVQTPAQSSVASAMADLPAGSFPTSSQISTLGKGRFIWPVKGQVISAFGTLGPGLQNDGLNIAAPVGTAVHAAAAGEVVFAGAYPGFGNLVLIKHGDGWVTDYGHLATITVRMKEKVSQGQVVGAVGQSGGVDRTQLHFEVRYAPNRNIKARAVDPALVLPTAP